MLDLLAFIALRSIILVLMLLPRKVGVSVLRALIWMLSPLFRKHQRIALINLKLAFPNASEDFYRSVIAGTYRSIASLIVDFAKLPLIDRKWCESHISFPDLDWYREFKAANPKVGIIIATGHLGSFELQGQLMGFFGYPISFLVRNFQSQLIDRWWNSMRERNGNEVISRRGGFKVALKRLRQGRDVAFLFDQNVTRNHAVFVNLFGRPAATTRAIGLAALRTHAPVVVAALIPEEDTKFKMVVKREDFSSLYEDSSLSDDQKITRITEVITRHYEEMIRQYPQGWFWMHRRWKTAEQPGEDGKLYNS